MSNTGKPQSTSLDGTINIDRGNNRIVITNTDGTALMLGALVDGTFGIAILDADQFELYKMNGQTWFWYDKVNDTNVMQAGLLPDGTYGWVVAKQGFNVADIFT